MTSFVINIAIDPDGLETIYSAELAVTLAQPVDSYVTGPRTGAIATGPDSKYPIAWIAFKPFQSNEVVVELDWFMFMTTTPLSQFNTLEINSRTDAPAVAGLEYCFRNGHFVLPVPTGQTDPDAYCVVNQASGQNIAFGLAQGATVNGEALGCAVVSATPVPLNMQASFYSRHVIDVFLSSCTRNGTILPYLPSDRLRLAVDATRPANVRYNNATKRFYLVSPT
ncbi:hypothetical protein WI36_26055 [Burkholderia ubonensis]|uniref:hypothetical protein n=1 Tax=Burkholderia ubonensis TaxID=101571 RepID=UPI00075C91E4|nr:hypothetical protein [Burkholderia ubonensis]KUZ65820.1 hypothetical protein WI36_26055 [Burkholderia ubonensis]